MTASANPSVSVVLAGLNVAGWLPETLAKLQEALRQAQPAAAEIIVVDDGSTDATADVAAVQPGPYPIRVIRIPHQGRFLARRTGVEAAQHDYIFFVDARVHIHPESLKFVFGQLAAHPDRQVWNGHVHVAKQGNIIARFGDAITFIGWRRYFANPRTTSYGLKDFDHYPKGTGCFFAPRAIVWSAIQEFERTSHNLEFSSDDTLMIRLIARDQPINLSPSFSCTYYARNTLGKFIRHTYHRGQFFVDGFLRPGTRFYYPLIGVLVGSVLLLLFILLRPGFIPLLLTAGAAIWLAELVTALALKTPPKDALSLFALTPVFTIVYAAGIWRAVIRKYMRT